MDISKLRQVSPFRWELPEVKGERKAVVLFGSRELIEAEDDKVLEQAANVARLPGLVGASLAMPDAHWGYGFPIGGVAAFDASDGVVSAGGVGFDISCGVRCLRTSLREEDVDPVAARFADELFAAIPAGVGSEGALRLSVAEIDEVLLGGAGWAVANGFGERRDLEYIEERGTMRGADPAAVSDLAKRRQRNEVGTLGSGNHYLEVQVVERIYEGEDAAAEAFGLREGQVVVSIHCGSRGLGHQIGTDYLVAMAKAAARLGITLPDRELACAPIRSPEGRAYLGAMRAGINCALANRQVLTHLARKAITSVFPQAAVETLFDVSHNTCKVERHPVDGIERELYVHRKGATRAFGPGHPDLPAAYRDAGQPVIIGGSMGTASYILRGTVESESLAFSSASHGAGRAMSRHEALRRWKGRAVVDDLAAHGILVRSRSLRGVAEEAPGAYKDVDAVAESTELAGLARRVARLRPRICVKG
jgi:tRNA-splicing ligase RtcB